ncbi:GTP-binding protein LepA [Mariniluteicoccus flavus]
MGADLITEQKILDHVQRLGEQHPPISMGSVDRTIHAPRLVRQRYSHVLDYLARVELEVDRNVLELLVLLPDVSEVDRLFYQDVWQPQEIQHGLILDRVQTDLGMAPAEPMLEIQMSMKVLGALSHLDPIQDVTRLLYYLTGASTERQATLAYNTFAKGLMAMGEEPLARTVVEPIKRQEPGHFAFYAMSATSLVQSGVLKPWQMFLARQLRSTSYMLVGVNGVKEFKIDMGGVIVELDIHDELEAYAREIGRLEARLLWANRRGMEFPPYILAALRESVDLYRERGMNPRLAFA